MNLQEQIIEFIQEHPSCSSKEIHENLEVSIATVKRMLSRLISEGLILAQGKLKGTKYVLSPSYKLLYPVDAEEYFKKEIDERKIRENFNLMLMPGVLKEAVLFTDADIQYLELLHQEYQDNISHLSKVEYAKELERLAIDLCWKSSQIEGNTYSLLETERLLKERETAAGKPKDDATMLLNHKEALNFIIENPDYIVPLSIHGIEDIHSLLIKDLGVDRNIRHRRVGISGTNYKPLDNEHQIREALDEMCNMINSKESAYEKALLALILLSYIQPFGDGNKRTARIISNALLMAYGYCPISFRTVDSVEYKKAMLIFYEQNNISAFKEIFKTQIEFAVKTYF